MARFVRFYRKLGRTRHGATAIEYGFLAALIAIAMLSAVTMLGESVIGLFGGITSEVSAAEARAKGNCGDGEGDGSAECDNK